MESSIVTLNERVLMLEDYSAPLHALSMDSNTSLAEAFARLLSEIHSLPRRQILEHKHWASLSRAIIKHLSEQNYIKWLLSERLLFQSDERKNFLKDKAEADRQELIKRLSSIYEDSSLFGYLAVRNLIFLASEGALIYDPYQESLANVSIITPTARQYIFDRLVVMGDLSQDEYSLWLKSTNLLLQPVTREFKAAFSKLLEFEIPYGLSPKASSLTLEALLSHAKNIALFPLIQGTSTVGNAIANHQWGIALEAAATTGVTVLIFLGTVTMFEATYRWLKSKSK